MKKVSAILVFLFVSQVVFGYNGDVNGDGTVTSSDVTAIYNYILYGDASAIVNGDVNGDGTVTSSDVTMIYNILLGTTPTSNHEYVDLGLPSGTLWATMNIGATSPEDYGDYFAWGETGAKGYYEWSSYLWCNGDYTSLTKYCTSSYYGYNGFVDNKIELDPEDDAATVNWGPDWQMPSMEQMMELYSNCTSIWTPQKGVYGILFISNNGESLFLPATGYRWMWILHDDGLYANYWSRTLFTETGSPFYAYYLFFDPDSSHWDNDYRCHGKTVRAVRVFQK